jgi:hypothetical protein
MNLHTNTGLIGRGYALALIRDSPDELPNCLRYSWFSGLPARHKRNSGQLLSPRASQTTIEGLIWPFSRALMSQNTFAARFGILPSTLRDWKQNRRHPDGAARVLLMVIDKKPDAVTRALAAADLPLPPPKEPQPAFHEASGGLSLTAGASPGWNWSSIIRWPMASGLWSPASVHSCFPAEPRSRCPAIHAAAFLPAQRVTRSARRNGS